MRSPTRKGLVAGGFVALVISIVHSQMFRADVFGWAELIAWYLVSLLLGCFAGLIAGFLTRLIPARLRSAGAYLGGALFGIITYYIQVYLFLLYMFGTTA